MRDRMTNGADFGDASRRNDNPGTWRSANDK